MSFDGIVIHALVQEFTRLLVGGRIHKIYQPQPTDLLLMIRAGGENHKLLLSANLSYPRAYLTDETFVNPQEPPMFTMLLRKHLDGGIIHSISQVGMERIIHFDIQTRDELGDIKMLRLIFELMGRHSNIILVDLSRNMILDGIHHVTPSISSYRQVLPGRPYVAPPEQDKKNPLDVDETTFLSMLSFNEGQLDKQMVNRFTGISPMIAREILHRAKLPTKENLWNAFSIVMADIRSYRFQPNIVTTQDQKSYFSAVALTHLEGERNTFDSISQCIETYYKTKADRDLVRQKAHDLLHILQQEKSKNEKKLEKLHASLDNAKKAEIYKLWGELITSFQYQVTKGAKSVQLPNYYEENEPFIEIPLDPNLSPNENAQVYFKRYNKAKNGLVIIQEQIERTVEEINYLEQVINQVEQADLEDLEEIREELIEQGYLRDRGKRTKERKRKESSPKPDLFRSSEGFTIYVGRNNKQNDYLTNRLAKPFDTWLHTKDIPGSHVVIQGEGFGEQTLHEAAMLAAYFSKGRNSSQVPVDYTKIKHVRKPNGAKPGYVIYDHHKTLYVTPSEDMIRNLKNSN